MANIGKHGNHVKGAGHYAARLSESQVMEIRNRYARGETCESLGLAFGVSGTQAHRIAKGKTWKHLPLVPVVAEHKSGPPRTKERVAPKLRGRAAIPAMSQEAIERLASRFWNKVDKSGECWIWTACRNPHGYGKFALSIDGKWRLRDAHRVAWELANDSIPDGICVCHKCDNPSCVNPSHLFLGTQAENLADMKAKKRGTLGDKSTALRMPEKLPRGAENVSTRLTPDQVRAIREQRTQGASQNEIARRFGISQSTVRQIVNRKTWKHLD